MKKYRPPALVYFETSYLVHSTTLCVTTPTPPIKQVQVYHLIFFLGIEEYCFFDIFKAGCSSNEVIMITEANYGRMRNGRCVQDGLGMQRCFINAIHFITAIFHYWEKYFGRCKCN